MRDFTLSEQNKDRILNGLLVCSILILVGGFVYETPARKDSSPVSNSYTNQQIRPITFNEHPVYDSVEALPVENTNSATSSNSRGSFTPATTQPRAAPKTSTTPKTSNSTVMQPSRLTSVVTKTVTDVLNIAPLNLL